MSNENEETFTEADIKQWLEMHKDKLVEDYAKVRSSTPIQRLLESKIGEEKCFQIFSASTLIKSTFEFIRLTGRSCVTDDSIKLALIAFAKRSTKGDPIKIASEIVSHAIATGGQAKNPPDQAEIERLEDKAEKIRALEELFKDSYSAKQPSDKPASKWI